LWSLVAAALARVNGWCRRRGYRSGWGAGPARRQRQELAPREQLLAELEDLGAAAEGGRSNGGQAVGVVIRGDDVEVGGE